MLYLDSFAKLIVCARYKKTTCLHEKILNIFPNSRYEIRYRYSITDSIGIT